MPKFTYRKMKSRFLKRVLNSNKTSSVGRVIILTGARQTGKTTLAKQCFADYSYLSIEDPVLSIQYKKLTAAQWKANYPFAILDEVQKEPVLINSIKSVYDQYEDVRYVLLGSSQLLLLEKVKETLAGRCIIEEVMPLTLPELLTDSWDDICELSLFQRFITNFKLDSLLPSFSLYDDFSKRNSVYEYYLQYGGYPALVKSDLSEEERREWLKMYVRTYLERDVRDLANFRSLEPFVKVQQMSALMTGQLINVSQFGNEADVNIKTAKRFLQYLEISYQTIYLQSWHRNKLKRLVKMQKLHYLDPGVHRAILNKKGAMSGHEYESAVIAEIYKQIKVLKVGCDLYHLRTHDGAEVDLLLEFETGYVAIEVKMTDNVLPKDARHLKKLDDWLDKPVIHSFVLSNDNSVKKLGENITAMPAAMFLT